MAEKSNFQILHFLTLELPGNGLQWELNSDKLSFTFWLIFLEISEPSRTDPECPEARRSQIWKKIFFHGSQPDAPNWKYLTSQI